MWQKIKCWLGFRHEWELIFDFKGNFWEELSKRRVKSYYKCKHCGAIKK